MGQTGITPSQLTQEIGRGRFQPVYYFYGEEDFRKAEAVKYIVNYYLPQQQRTLNFIRLTVEKNDFESICGEIAAIPMLGERRLVLIDEIQKLKPTQQKKFFSLLASPLPDTVVILSSPASRTPDKKSAFFRDVGQMAEVIQFSRLTESMAQSKIEKFLETSGFTFDKDAIELLISVTDGDSGGLTGELEKLVLYSEAEKHIGMDEVKAVASSYVQFNVFELIDLISTKSSEKALLAYQDLTQKGTRPESLLWQLSSHMINLLKIHTGKQVMAKPFVVNKLRQQARVFSRQRTVEAITLIAETERSLRRSRLRPEFLVENLIRKISA